MMTEAMSEWQNDCAAYLPAKELKKADMLIVHGSCVIDLHCVILHNTALSSRNQHYYTGIIEPLPDKISRREIFVQRKTVSFIMLAPLI
jgi:hypothetical protein